MSGRLGEIFKEHRKCFIPFVTAGHPNLELTQEIVFHLIEAGSQIVEIGIPFSDPIADGPIIQHSSLSALRHGHTMTDYLELVRRLREKSGAGLIFMTYLNPLLSYGLERFGKEAVEAGLDGILVSDLSPEEYVHMGLDSMPALRTLDTVFLVAPTSSPERLHKICRLCRGFLYLVARTGVTGAHSEIDTGVSGRIDAIRRLTDLPVAVGFGIRNADDVRRVWRCADGAVVGSAIVRFIEEHRDRDDLPVLVGEFVRKNLISSSPVG